MSTGLGTDFAWTFVDGVGDIDEDWSVEEDPRNAYAQNLARLLTCAILWYAPTKVMDVREYLQDIATDQQMQMRIQQVVDGDERTARSSVKVTRPTPTARDIAVEAWDKRGKVHKLTLAIEDVDGAIIVGLR